MSETASTHEPGPITSEAILAEILAAIHAQEQAGRLPSGVTLGPASYLALIQSIEAIPRVRVNPETGLPCEEAANQACTGLHIHTPGSFLRVACSQHVPEGTLLWEYR